MRKRKPKQKPLNRAPAAYIWFEEDGPWAHGISNDRRRYDFCWTDTATVEDESVALLVDKKTEVAFITDDWDL